MSSIDLVILGMVMEGPRSAYDLQKDVEAHHFSRWTKISVPSVYRKVLQLCEQGYLERETVQGERGKTVYAVTAQGRAYFRQLMASCAAREVPLLFDFNVVVANLNKLEPAEALALTERLRDSIAASARINESYAARYADIPLVGRTIFRQQQWLYQALLQWLDEFVMQLRGDGNYGG